MSWWVLAAMGASIVSSQIVGMLWYGPLLGKQWMREMGWESMTKKELEANQKQAMPGYITSAAAGAVATGLLWILLVEWQLLTTAFGSLATPLAGIMVGLMAWAIGYIPGTITGRFFKGQSWILWGIGAGYWGIMAALWGLWVGVFGSI